MAKADIPTGLDDGLFDNISQAQSPSAKDASRNLGSLEVAHLLESLTFETPEYELAMSIAHSIVARARTLRRPGGMLIVGSGGTGKTFLCKAIETAFPREESKVKLSVPALYLLFSKRLTPNQLARLLLTILGHEPTLLRDDEHVLRQSLLKALEACDVCVLIFDEAHHLLPVSSNQRSEARLMGETGDWIKSLCDEACIGCIFAGTPYLEEVFKRDTQFNTRWSSKIHLAKLSSGEPFLRVLKNVDEALPFRKKSCLYRAAIHKAIYQVTGGNFRLIIALLGEAVTIAIERKSDMLEPCDLCRGHAVVFGQVENPFERIAE